MVGGYFSHFIFNISTYYTAAAWPASPLRATIHSAHSGDGQPGGLLIFMTVLSWHLFSYFSRVWFFIVILLFFFLWIAEFLDWISIVWINFRRPTNGYRLEPLVGVWLELAAFSENNLLWVVFGRSLPRRRQFVELSSEWFWQWRVRKWEGSNCSIVVSLDVVKKTHLALLFESQQHNSFSR